MMYSETRVYILIKTLFCYNYVNSLARLNKHALPLREAFCTKLDGFVVSKQRSRTFIVCGRTFTDQALTNTLRFI